MIRYISTRGNSPALSFEDVVIAGLAPDGGLYLPDSIPQLDLKSLAGKSYVDVAYQVIRPFVGGSIPDDVLKVILADTYKDFRDPAVAPLKKLSENEYLLELFHGPTLAFKDFALQFLARIMAHILAKRNEQVTVIGATSGDTGSAAIAAFRGQKNMRIFILHPKGRTSDIQRKQMTTVLDDNVFNMAVEGTFDDCQDIVKALFADQDFRAKQKPVAVNSINWGRILAQVVYYVYAALKFPQPATFSVPTGNFGDIYAGYIAKQMGLPINKLIIATNSNDILDRCLKTGVYGMTGVTPTLSPSMDIQVSSNFERLLFDLYVRDGKKISELMGGLRTNKKMELAAAPLAELRKTFESHSVDDVRTKQTIADVYKQTGEILDPHTAVGVAAGRACHKDKSPLITLATAHPAKFPDAVRDAIGIEPALPEHLAGIMTAKECFTTLPASAGDVKAYIETHV